MQNLINLGMVRNSRPTGLISKFCLSYSDWSFEGMDVRISLWYDDHSHSSQSEIDRVILFQMSQCTNYVISLRYRVMSQYNLTYRVKMCRLLSCLQSAEEPIVKYVCNFFDEALGSRLPDNPSVFNYYARIASACDDSQKEYELRWKQFRSVLVGHVGHWDMATIGTSEFVQFVYLFYI